MLLENRNAVIYGGAGAIGSVVAKAFAREGARVYLAGRTLAKVEAAADSIRAAGGLAESAVVDPLDEASSTPSPTGWPPRRAAWTSRSTSSTSRTSRALRSRR